MKAAICDDDEIFALDLRKRLKDRKSIRSIDVYTKAITARPLSEEGYDVIFLDIDWKTDKTGIDIASELYNAHCPAKIVYMTAYTEKFVQQMLIPDTNIEGFLIKPIEDKWLDMYLNKIQNQQSSSRKKMLRVTSNGSDRAISMDDIMYIGSGNHTVELYRKDTMETVPGNLKALETQLTDEFARCHKCYIVNMNYIKIRTAQKLTMEDGKTITIGRLYSTDFRKKYQDFIASKL